MSDFFQRRIAQLAWTGILAGGLGLLACSGCRPGTGVREYVEVVTEPPSTSATATEHVAHAGPQTKAAAQSTAGADSLQWSAPAGWLESPGDGMRLATFAVPQTGGTGTCTIVALAGEAGGLEANVRRWVGQLDLTLPPEADWRAFLARQESFTTTDQVSGTLVDLTQLPGTEGRMQDSMLAASILIQGQTVFVKLTGPPALLQQEKGHFLELCKSLRVGT